MGRGFECKPLSCAVNPAAGRERYYEIKPAAAKKKVMIIGGGVAGMEAARTASLRGHEVTLYELSDKLGGVVVPGSIPDFKVDDRRLLEWYRNEMKELGIKIVLNTKVTEETVDTGKPDIVIIATGSREIKMNVTGIEKEKVSTAVEVLNGKNNIGENILMVGGGLVGCETALYLAEQGRKVTIIEQKDSLLSAGNPVPHMNKIMLLDLLKNHNVEIVTNTSLLEVTDSGATVIDNKFGKKDICADTVVLAAGFKPENALYNKLRSKIVDLYLIGDANKVANIMDAIWSGNEIGLNC